MNIETNIRNNNGPESQESPSLHPMIEAYKNNNGQESQPSLYPEDFVEKVKAAFPYDYKLHEALDSGKRIVGGLSMSFDEIIEAFKNNNPKKVLEAAELAKKINEFYKEYLDFSKGIPNYHRTN